MNNKRGHSTNEQDESKIYKLNMSTQSRDSIHEDESTFRSREEEPAFFGNIRTTTYDEYNLRRETKKIMK